MLITKLLRRNKINSSHKSYQRKRNIVRSVKVFVYLIINCGVVTIFA
uniref:Uncharacterized protein n=1 Tax=Myoviridae sp. ctniE2 TaxID=2825172 RepID=A0A8S5PGR3_9CAUD|nr:MAG TPA: hypothetical protein [Myoviridae sp. ctniE2]